MTWDNVNLTIAVNEITGLMDTIYRKRVAIKKMNLQPTDWETMDDALSRAYSDLTVITRAYEKLKK